MYELLSDDIQELNREIWKLRARKTRLLSDNRKLREELAYQKASACSFCGAVRRYQEGVEKELSAAKARIVELEEENEKLKERVAFFKEELFAAKEVRPGEEDE